MLFILSLLLLALLPLCHTACTSSAACYPPIENIAPRQNTLSISATSTCGQEVAELSCPLLVGDLTQCYNCSASEHSSAMGVDGDNATWWQASNDVTDVTLQLDFSAPLLVSESSLLWHRPRARSMLLEYSTDSAVTWSVYQYHSPNCQFDFLLPATSNPGDVSHGTAAVCDNTQSNINPYSGGEVSFSPAARIEGGITNFSSAALDYFLVTNLRARMLSFNRLVGLIDEGYSHAVSEWRVYGSCFCNGHGDACDAAVLSTCLCGHNTEGENCERCLPLFNNKPYQAGTLAQANVCEQCQCNSHATSCLYDNSVGSGVCQNCQDNTAGASCDSCLPFFYRDLLLLLTDPDICRPCDCLTEGTAAQSTALTPQPNISCVYNETSVRYESGYNIPTLAIMAISISLNAFLVLLVMALLIYFLRKTRKVKFVPKTKNIPPSTVEIIQNNPTIQNNEESYYSIPVFDDPDNSNDSPPSQPDTQLMQCPTSVVSQPYPDAIQVDLDGYTKMI